MTAWTIVGAFGRGQRTRNGKGQARNGTWGGFKFHGSCRRSRSGQALQAGNQRTAVGRRVDDRSPSVTWHGAVTTEPPGGRAILATALAARSLTVSRLRELSVQERRREGEIRIEFEWSVCVCVCDQAARGSVPLLGGVGNLVSTPNGSASLSLGRHWRPRQAGTGRWSCQHSAPPQSLFC